MVTYFIIGFLFLVSLIYFIKYKKVKKALNIFNEPLRKGYYELQLVAKIDSTNFTTRVFVKELERYRSGESKIEILDIEYCVSEIKVTHEHIKERVLSDFKSIMKTSDIHWLELEDDLLKDRQEKLLKIMKRIKKSK